ncbi:putative PLAC8 motif-containing protein [Lupinus albus]|uniref:Putative PLAC8 motif-containing protein n=1 Tax=Lupinus albus TaxID=3870 RepID=A0A6A4P1P1_LUPAL|nr:putative PLAC8 motif-containing protein [Lupinus albus]
MQFINLIDQLQAFVVCAGCIGFLCPCFVFGKNAEFLGSGTFLGSCVTHFLLWTLVNISCLLLTDGLFLGLPGCIVTNT